MSSTLKNGLGGLRGRGGRNGHLPTVSTLPCPPAFSTNFFKVDIVLLATDY